MTDSHEEHKLDHGRGSQQLTEGVHKQVIGQQGQLDQQHQRVVVGLEHLRCRAGPTGPPKAALVGATELGSASLPWGRVPPDQFKVLNRSCRP